ncbi:hypothetical protein PVIIG_00425 [Plasmodium vivax India VII]|uniref:Variable surface protein n=1 Tax=Plasmodium vivax India VII TaxID=1077284 RepID=A0A0J9S4U7_PLAVI|nr:hypothetical protein PVIIG_00425 [Plasmodium vivax India VII]
MNFWLNYKLSSFAYNESQKLKFYQVLASKYSTFKAEGILKNKMSVMDDKYFNNMSIVYNVYKMLYGTPDIKIPKCDDFLENFKKLYNEGLKKCYMDGDINLSKELEKFKYYYMKKDLNNVNSCIKNNIPTLPKLSLFEPENKTKLKTCDNASELLHTKYKYSVDRLPNIEDAHYNNLKDLILVHYNLLLEYKENEQNFLMMKILHQFFQYCNENKINMKLSLCMKEFIKEYYDKYKSEYKEIFGECKNELNSKEHRRLYKICKNKFKNDLYLIETNPENYINQQEVYIKNLSPLELMIMQAKAMFLDSEAMSRYLPTIMSTIVAIVVCFFFLYKVHKNYI